VDPGILQPLLGDTRVLKVFHHGSFDLRFLRVAGVTVARVADTMLAQQLLDGGEKTAQGVGLAALASFRLGLQLDKSMRDTFARPSPPTGAQLRYAADDAAATWGVFDQQWHELVGHGLTRVAQIEFHALPVLADLQLRGVAFEPQRWAGVVGELERELPALEERLQAALVAATTPHDLFGPVPVNLESPEQVRDALARLGVEVPTTREWALREHAEHPAVAALLDYRQVSRVTSNWGGGWARRVVHPQTGRIHADWRQIVGTGRIACSDPNLTQVPRHPRYRACFGGSPGRMLVVADYSQQELRILAAVSGDEALTSVFHRGGDLHRVTAATLFGVDEQAVTPTQRAAAKQLSFGLLYGMGLAGFARTTGLPRAQAQETMQRYFAAFPRASSWLADAEARGRRSGKVRTALGRIRAIGGDDGGPPPGTLARNAPIQGAGADMTKLALAEVHRRLSKRFGIPVSTIGTGVAADGLVLVVHDELVAEVPEDDAAEAAELVAGGMVDAAAEILGEVPAHVDVHLRRRWGEANT
jgi:DNA polymerase I